MLADYTRKTQDLAVGRRQLVEIAGNMDPATLRDARELYEQLQDQNNWPQLYTHLQDALSEAGLLNDGKLVAQHEAAGAPPAGLESALDGDPELAPIAQHVRSLQAEIRELREELDAGREADQAYQEQLVQQATRAQQEAALRSANPHYKDEDIAEIRALSAAFGGDRMRAAQLFEANRQRHVAAYLAGKRRVATTTPAPPPGAAVTAADVQQDFGSDLDAAHEAGMAELRAALGSD